MRGDLVDLFHRHVDGGQVDRMSFAVEVLLDRSVTDAFGDTAEVNHSRLRLSMVPAYRKWWIDTRDTITRIGYRRL